MSSRVAGFKELIEKMNRIALDAPVAAANGAYEGMQNIMVQAKADAPKDTETMARSGYVAPPEVRGGVGFHMESGFGGGSEEYVVRQHEDLGLNHPNGGKARFFIDALDAGRGQLMDAISRYVKESLTTGRFPRKPAKIVPSSPTEDVPPGAGP